MSNGEYFVESILDRKKEFGILKYKVKWDGYPIEQATWEPVDNLSNCMAMVKTFDEKIKNQENEVKQKLVNKIMKRHRKLQKANSEVGSPREGSVEGNSLSTEAKVKEYEIMEQLNSRVVKEILNAKRIKGEVYCLCSYEATTGRKRKNPNVPPKYIPSSLIKTHYPKLYMDFLESKIKFTYQK